MNAAKDRTRNKLSRSRRGQVIIITALLVPVLGSFMGLAIDVGMFYHVRRRVQTAADSGAMGGANEVYRRNTVTQVLAAARNDVKLNGFDDDNLGDDDPTVTVVVNNPPLSGTRAGNLRAVEVIVTQQLPTYFMRFANRSTITVQARAVASLVRWADGCVMALDPTMEAALDVVGVSTLTANCGVMVNSTADLAIRANGGGCIYGDEVGVTGNYVSNGTANCIYPTPVTDVPPMLDPLSYLPLPYIPSPLTPAAATAVNYRHNEGDPDAVINPGIYMNGIRVTGGKVTFQPGLYIIAGDGFRVLGNATVEGDGVTFYLTNGPGGWAEVFIAGTATARLTAPTTGDYTGMLFFQDPASPDIPPGSMFAGTEDSSLTGAIYFPSTRLTWTGTSTNADWTMIIANNIQVNGDAVVNGGFTKSIIPPPTWKPTLVE